jgi:hypothetical protein
MTPLERDTEAVIENIHNSVIIFEHVAAFIEIHPSLKDDVHYITDPRLDEPENWQNPDTFFPIFMQNMKEALSTKKSVIVMDYNPAVALCISTLLEICPSDELTPFVCLIFFHYDEETSLTHIDGIDNLLDTKFDVIVSLLDFPFIKKFEVLLGYKITFPYIKGLLNQIFDP